MAKLKDKIKTGLQEDRMLVLAVQVLLGFACRAAFEPGFERLPLFAQYMKLGSFALLLISLALLLTAPSYHRIVEGGEDTVRFSVVLRRIMECALLPFALALGLDLAVSGHKLFGAAGGIGCGVATGLGAIFFWYGIEIFCRSRDGKNKSMNDKKAEKTPLEQKIEQVLTEARIVLPGAQALLGFQLSTFLMDAFDKLPRQSQVLHLAALGCIALTVILLMTPPAFHRIVEDGEDTQRFHRLANRFVVSAMVPLALGITADFYIVTNKVTASPGLALSLSLVAIVMFYGLWFAFPLLTARRHSPGK